MSKIDEEKLSFSFPDSWIVCKYDAQPFYRNKFIKIHEGLKGVDFCAVDPDEKKL